MADGSWHFFIPVAEALPVPEKYCTRKFASGLIKELDGTIRYRADDVLMVFHQRAVTSPPYPQLNAASEVLYERLVSSSGSADSRFPDFGIKPVFTVAEIVVNRRMFIESGKSQMDDEERDAAISKAFDFALVQLNTWLKALALLLDRPVPATTRESLPPMVPFAKGLWEPSDLDSRRLPKLKPGGVINLHSNLPALNEPPVPNERLETWMNSALENSFIPGPFFSFHDFLNDAKYHHRFIGNYRVAAILYASACEALLDELLQHMLWEEGARPENAYRDFFGGRSNNLRPLGVVALVKKKIYPKLNAAASSESLPEQLTAWIEEVAILRNNVIHNGYDPHLDDIKKCVKAAENLSLYLSDRVFDKRDDYPITALALLGEDGLVRRSDWERFSQLETNVNEFHLRLSAFRNWSRHLAVFRQHTGILNSSADPNDGVMCLIMHSSGEQSVYALHSSKAVATEIPWEIAINTGVFQRLQKLGVEENGIPMDPKVIINDEAGGFSLPEGARWDRCWFDVIPGTPCQFDELRDVIGYKDRFG